MTMGVLMTRFRKIDILDKEAEILRRMAEKVVFKYVYSKVKDWVQGAGKRTLKPVLTSGRSAL